MKSHVDKMSGRRRYSAAAFYAFLAMSVCAAESAETLIYKSIDADGTPVFTDQPAPSATLVKPSRLNVMDAPRTKDASVSGTPAGAEAAAQQSNSTDGTGGADENGTDAGSDGAATGSTDGMPVAGRDPSADPDSSPEAAQYPGSDAAQYPSSDSSSEAAQHSSSDTDTANPADSERSADSTTVDAVSILAPLDRQTLIDPEGPVWVEFSISPAAELPKGMTAQVRLNDALVVTGGSTRLPMDVPERGAHRLQVTLVDVSGKAVAESAPIEIYVKLPTVAGSN
jgi:hypothetical protein